MTTPTPTDLQTDFLVSYEGPALANNTMQIRDLAPALLALGQAFDRANSVLNGDKASMGLEIKATQAGSFEIALVLKQLYDAGVSAFSSDFVTSAANLKELFFGNIALGSGAGGVGVLGLFGLIKKLKGKRISVATADGPNMIFEADNVRLVIPLELFRLYQDLPLREQIAAVVRPVVKQGIERVKFKDDGVELESVDKDDAQFFRGAEEEYGDAITSVIPRVRLKPSRVSFVQRGKWKLSDGEKTRWYTVADQDFIGRINAGEVRIGAKDVFICQVLSKQLLSEEGDLKMEYEITSVLDHIPPTEQGRLLSDGAGITLAAPEDGD